MILVLPFNVCFRAVCCSKVSTLLEFRVSRTQPSLFKDCQPKLCSSLVILGRRQHPTSSFAFEAYHRPWHFLGFRFATRIRLADGISFPSFATESLTSKLVTLSNVFVAWRRVLQPNAGTVPVAVEFRHFRYALSMSENWNQSYP